MAGVTKASGELAISQSLGPSSQTLRDAQDDRGKGTLEAMPSVGEGCDAGASLPGSINVEAGIVPFRRLKPVYSPPHHVQNIR